MKLKRATENVLRIMAPTWMKRLERAKWNKEKLSKKIRLILDNNAQQCFIGEIHCMSWDYINGKENPCDECEILCNDVPRMMQTYKTSMDKVALLDRIAEHVVEVHPDLLIKKTLLRAHKVFAK